MRENDKKMSEYYPHLHDACTGDKKRRPVKKARNIDAVEECIIHNRQPPMHNHLSL